jgi:transglutaminase-like putative cysteine protease
MKAPSPVWIRLGVIVFVLSFVRVVGADGTAAYQGARWAGLDVAKVQAAAAGITTASQPGCDEVIVEQRLVRAYRPDGTAETQDETFVKVLTEVGKNDNRLLRLQFELPYSRVEVVRLEVLKPDGSIVPVDVAANSKETIDDQQMQINIYDPNSRVLQVNIPELAAGDLVHSITRQTIVRAVIEGEYAEGCLLEGRGFIRHLSIEINAPVAKDLKKIAIRDEIPGTVHYTCRTADDGSQVHNWEVNNVPRMYNEPAMPPYENVLQRLWVSTLPDWKDVSRWYWKLSKPHLDALSPELKQKVAELTAGKDNAMERIKALFYYVSKAIRYMGVTPEKDRPGFEPHDVCLTFEKKYGVCRDKAGLLVAMLRTAGFEAYPVLTSVGNKRDAEIPDYFFNHAIVAVSLKPGQYILMDPTDENTRDLLPAEEADQSYLVCRPEGEAMQLSPVPPPADNMMRIRTTGSLSAGGHLEATSELAFGGINDNAFRGAFAQMKPDDRRRLFENFVKQTVPGSTLKALKLEPENMLDSSVPVHATIAFAADGMTAIGSGKAIVNVPWIGKSFGIVNYIMGGTGLERRKYPMRTFVACGLSEEVSIRLAAGFEAALSLPGGAPIDNECVGYRQVFNWQSGVLTGTRELELKVVEFSPAQYQQLKKTLERIELDVRKAPVLAVAPGTVAGRGEFLANAGPQKIESDIRVLESRRMYDVQDEHASVLRVKNRILVLSYNGKKEFSELKIPYNPACEDVRLEHGTVVSPDGARREISEGEIHVMDAGWNASARRYTGGKLLVANFPGVEIGSTIEMEYVVTSHDRPFLSAFIPFQATDELVQKTVTVRAPAGLPVRTWLTGPAGIVQEKKSTEAGRQSTEWRADNVKPLPSEPLLPPEWAYEAGAGFYVGEEQAYLRRLTDAMLDRSRQSAKASALARELAAKAGPGGAAVRAIRDHIARSIRLAGPAFDELPLTELSGADTTLADGYGHAADRAILCHAMLSAAGFQPEFVLASDLTPAAGLVELAQSLPLPTAFATPLVRVNVDGTTYYLNDTDQYAWLGSTAHEGKLALVLPDGSHTTVEAAGNGATRTEVLCRMTVDDNGKTRISLRRQYFGNRYNEKKKYFSEVTPEDRHRYHQSQVSKVAQGARPVGDLSTRFEEYPGVEEFAVEVDRYAIADGKFEYFPLPVTPQLVPAPTDHRELPFYIGWRSDERVRTEIELPPTRRNVVISPRNQDLEEPAGGGAAHIARSLDHGRLILTYGMVVSPAIIPANHYEEVRAIEAALQQKSAKVILVEAGPAEAGAGRN